MSDALNQFRPVERSETLADRVYGELRTAIMAGRFRPGEKLTIRAVAKALDVSLTPAREALFNLVAEGALESGPNGSAQIPLLTKERIEEITKIRSALEGLAAKAAAPNLDEPAIGELRELNDALLAANAKGDYERVMVLNWKFHFRIYQQAGMPILQRMLESCWLMAGSYLNVIYPEFGEVDRGIENHLDIIAAIEARDAKKLRDAVQRDIEFAASTLLKAVRRGPPQPG